MTLNIELPPDLEARLASEAQAQGIKLDVYVRSVLDQSVHSKLPEPAKLTDEEFEAALDRMAQFSDKIPSLPSGALSRKSLYDNHD